MRILPPRHKLLVGKTSEIVCQSTGSKPSAHIEWRVGTNKLESLTQQTSDDGSVTTGFLSYVPSIDDNHKQLSCLARNSRFNDDPLSDTIKLDIRCKYNLSLI